MSAGSHGDAHFRYVLRLADTNLVLAQRLGALIGNAPALEEDLGLGNVALDLLGQARMLLTHAGALEGRGRDEDALAFLREERDFLNATLVEQPNGDFAQTIVRQFLFDAWQLATWSRLESSTDPQLAAIAAKGVKEARYHLRFSSGWVVRLGDGTAESHARAQAALDALWPHTAELFDADEIDRAMQAAGVGVDLAAVCVDWDRQVDGTLAEATLARPADHPWRWYGKRGQHGEHLGRLLAEMQYMQRTYPGANW
ncbi:MAG TPA: phenylacetate-CoA oxygenase subunit PaaC [Steroidobacteraceae bacterium]|nr:phenylacetate-CoA oxygenase subunit PaaC [Steroidobacteraceae bacterium]HNS27909.1 phenylacetate-CoA oxygenase subunit PaaC [Steroidobacteraceae bacterium]